MAAATASRTRTPLHTLLHTNKTAFFSSHSRHSIVHLHRPTQGAMASITTTTKLDAACIFFLGDTRRAPSPPARHASHFGDERRFLAAAPRPPRLRGLFAAPSRPLRHHAVPSSIVPRTYAGDPVFSYGSRLLIRETPRVIPRARCMMVIVPRLGGRCACRTNGVTARHGCRAHRGLTTQHGHHGPEP
jgi:hypothetical protein